MLRSTSTRVWDMPTPGLRQAPNFDLQNPKELQEFLKKFEKLAKRCKLMTKEKTKMVVKYVDRETRKFWTRLKGYGDDYARLKKKIMRTYSVTNFIQSYLHQFFNDSHCHITRLKPLKRTFN